MIQDSNNYWEQLERLEKLIRASEFKAGVVFSFHGLILGFFVDNLEQLKPIYLKNNIFISCAVIWLIFVLLSIFHCFKCFRPQIELKYDPNVFFFRDAVYAFGDIKKYSKRLIEVCEREEELFVQLSEQIHAESKIIDQKFKSVHKAIRYFVISFIVIIMANVLWVIKLYT